jgi:hypothetical protein
MVSRSRSTSALPIPARSMKLSSSSNSTFPLFCFPAKNKAAANRDRNTVEFLGIWESVFNPDFNYGEFATIKPIEFDGFRPTSTLHPT